MQTETTKETLLPPTTDNIYCMSCQYQLNHIPSNTCPECGSPFDPSKPQTYFNQIQINYKRDNIIQHWLLFFVTIPISFILLAILAVNIELDLYYDGRRMDPKYPIILPILWFAILGSFLTILSLTCPNKSKYTPIILCAIVEFPFLPIIADIFVKYQHESEYTVPYGYALTFTLPALYTTYKLYKYRLKHPANKQTKFFY